MPKKNKAKKVKAKTNKAIASRVKVTGTGKLMIKHPGHRRTLTKKSSARKRHLAKSFAVNETHERRYKELMGV